MRIQLTVIIICISFIASAQEKKQAPKKEAEEENIFAKIEVEAHTDRATFQRYIAKNITLPDSVWNTLEAGQDKVTVVFIIDQYGRMTDVKAENAAGNPLAALAVKILRNYPGKWTPANQCGRNVKAYKKETLQFCLRAD